MKILNLGDRARIEIDSFINKFRSASSQEKDAFISSFAKGNKSAWHRFIVGTYNHPVTWWIGIFQLSMQMGMWGHVRRKQAVTRASVLWQILSLMSYKITEDNNNVEKKEQDSPSRLEKIIKYNLQYRKADIVGRFIGGQFTNYTTNRIMIDKFGVTRKAKLPVSMSNFVVASYGAAIKAIIENHKSGEAIVQAILTGNPEELPSNIQINIEQRPSKEEEEILKNLEATLIEIGNLSNVSPGPVSIDEFCSRPENRGISGICK